MAEKKDPRQVWASYPPWRKAFNVLCGVALIGMVWMWVAAAPDVSESPKITQAVNNCKDMIVAAEPESNRDSMTVPTKHVDPEGMVLVRVEYTRGDAYGWDKRAARCNADPGEAMTLRTYARD